MCILVVRVSWLYVYFGCTCILVERVLWLYVYFGCTCSLVVCVFWLYVYFGWTCILVERVLWLYVYFFVACILVVHVVWLYVYFGCMCILVVCVIYLLKLGLGINIHVKHREFLYINNTFIKTHQRSPDITTFIVMNSKLSKRFVNSILYNYVAWRSAFSESQYSQTREGGPLFIIANIWYRNSQSWPCQKCQTCQSVNCSLYHLQCTIKLGNNVFY